MGRVSFTGGEEAVESTSVVGVLGFVGELECGRVESTVGEVETISVEECCGGEYDCSRGTG